MTGEITIASVGLLERMEALVDRVEALEARLEQPAAVGWYGVKEAAVYLSISVRAVYAAERSGKLVATRDRSGHLKFLKEWLDDFATNGGQPR